mmetsp:Transcript_95168/g.188536  ORF Transcript_95168/g.188536 Transcript_95168/m.188536 type:complete len:346 (+) Transcript_95168:82-1119(+)
MEQWQLGIGASCLSSLLSTIGVQCRILAVSFEGGKMGWILELCGWCIWVSGQGLGQVAIALAPATIAACLSFSGTLLWNAMLAPVVLQERLTRLHGLGVLLLSFGAVLVMRFSSCKSQEYSGDHFLELAQRGPFMGLASCFYGLALVLVARTFCKRDRLDAVSFAFLFALCGATDLTVTKFALQVLVAWGAATPLQPSTALAVSLASAMVCLHLACLCFQAVSTKYGEALQNIPLFLGSGFIMQFLLSGTFYEEFKDFDTCRSAVVALGLAFMLVGLRVTSHAAQDATPAAHDEVLLEKEVVSKLEEPHILPRMESMLSMDMERTMMCLSSPRLLLKNVTPPSRS